MDTRFCPWCASNLPVDQFFPKKSGGWYTGCRKCRNRYSREHYSPEKQRWALRMRKYGVSREWVEAAEAKGCAICAAPSPECVDHDHATGKVRGLLCHDCNRALGLFRDDTVRMSRAIEYLNDAEG